MTDTKMRLQNEVRRLMARNAVLSLEVEEKSALLAEMSSRLARTAAYREELLRRALPHLEDRVRDDNDADHEDEDLLVVYYDIREELRIKDTQRVPRINFTGDDTEDETHG